jgi:hypothetical protein
LLTYLVNRAVGPGPEESTLLTERGIIVRENPLEILVNGKKLENLQGDTVAQIVEIDQKMLLVLDWTPNRNVHAYDLNGNWLWDIESCDDVDVRKNQPVWHFFNIMGVVDETLYLGNFPYTFVTNLYSGKGTRFLNKAFEYYK